MLGIFYILIFNKKLSLLSTILELLFSLFCNENSDGKTIKVYKDTFNPQGNLVRRKDK